MDIVCKILYDITVYTKIIGTLEKWNFHKVGFKTNPVSKIVEKTVCMSVFLATWHCNLSAELTKTHSSRRKEVGRTKKFPLS